MVCSLPDPGEWTELAWRIQLLHRRNLISALAELRRAGGAWQGSGSLDEVLIGLSRAASAPQGAPMIRRLASASLPTWTVFAAAPWTLSALAVRLVVGRPAWRCC